MAFKMKGSSYKMGGHKTKATMAYMKSPLEKAKPDYIDIDKDGNKTESMKGAAKSIAKMKSPMKQEVAAATEPVVATTEPVVEEKVNPYGDHMRSVEANTWKQINTGDISENWRGLQEDLKRARRLGYDESMIKNLKRTMNAVQKHMERNDIPLQ